MLRFRVTRIIPPGNVYFYELNSVAFEAYTLRDLLTQVRKYCGAEGIKVSADLEAEVIDHMCRKLPEDFCYGDLDGKPRARAVTMQQIKNATMAKAAVSERVLLPEAKRRAIICANCTKNDRSLCPTCVGLVSWSRRLVGQQLGAREEWLGVCLVDAVSLSAVVHLDDKQPEGEYPECCWRKK